MHLMAWGQFLFELRGLAFDELQRRADWRHARAPRVGAADAAQFVGQGEETVSLSGSVYAEIANGPASLDALRRAAATGEAQPLVDGRGTVYGDFVVTGVDERHAYMMADGRARRIDFGIDLLRVAPKQP